MRSAKAIKGEKSLVEICAENKISKTSVIEWRDKLASEAKSIFIPVHEKEKKEKALIQEIELLHKIIGEMTVTTNFLRDFPKNSANPLEKKEKLSEDISLAGNPNEEFSYNFNEASDESNENPSDSEEGFFSKKNEIPLENSAIKDSNNSEKNSMKIRNIDNRMGWVVI